MLSTIPLLTFLIFSVTYPLCFWLSARDPLQKNFHHFHIGLPNVTAGLCVLGMFWLPMPQGILIKATVWLIMFFVLTFIFWSKPTVSPVMITIVSLIGLNIYVHAHTLFLGFDPAAIFANVLAGFILSAALYAMNLGHWYLNVHGLDLKHLKSATIALGVLLAVRFIWDIIISVRSTVLFRGEIISILQFIGRLDGLFLLVAFFFGTLFPLVSMYFVWGTLKAKSTQSATGILYVLLSAILIGDITYKYYLVHYQIPL